MRRRAMDDWCETALQGESLGHPDQFGAGAWAWSAGQASARWVIG
jgi:hypothetical protein